MFLLLPLAAIITGDMGPAPVVIPQTAATVTTCPGPSMPSFASNAPPLWLAASGSGSKSPGAAVRSDQADLTGPLELWRAPDGLFYVDGAINGQPVRFVVDTGASMVVLTESDAQRAGVVRNSDGPTVEAQTVSGKSTMAHVTLASMQIGSTGNAAVPAAVAPDGLGVSLLGQSWLSQLASVTIEGDRMILR
jgi:aspartyl protease family protein